MKYTGQKLTDHFEGCRLEAYQDGCGIWTIGYGHTKNVYKGMVITEDQAIKLQESDIAIAEQCVSLNVKVPLTQDEFNALVDFTYNLGCRNFRTSTMLTLLNKKDYIGAAAQFNRWDYGGGKQIAGLLYRRMAETKEFDGESYA